MMNSLRSLVESIEGLQTRFPNLFGFMNWSNMGSFYNLVRTELRADKHYTVLDFGSGRGAYAHLFDSRNYIGVDISADLIKYALKKNPNHTFIQMDGTSLTFEDNEFDNVLIVGVLHHLSTEQMQISLREIRRVLKPDGEALIIEPVPAIKNWNLVSKLFKALDGGQYIRHKDVWRRFIEEELTVTKMMSVRINFNDLIILRVAPPIRE